MFPRDIVCLRNMSINTLHKRDDDDDDNNNNNNNDNNNNCVNPLNAELNPICHLLALLGAHHIFHVSGLRVNIFRGKYWPVVHPKLPGPPRYPDYRRPRDWVTEQPYYLPTNTIYLFEVMSGTVAGERY